MDKKQLASLARSAIQEAGGPAALSRTLTEQTGEEISQWRVQKWSINGVPPIMVLEIEKATGCSRHDLRPDLYPREAA